MGGGCVQRNIKKEGKIFSFYGAYGWFSDGWKEISTPYFEKNIFLLYYQIVTCIYHI